MSGSIVYKRETQTRCRLSEIRINDRMTAYGAPGSQAMGKIVLKKPNYFSVLSLRDGPYTNQH
jgi:hypothetical protein